MLFKLLNPDAGHPLWLFGLRLAARVSNYLLLAFALFLLFAASPNPFILGYSLLILSFCLFNLRAITLAKRAYLSDGTIGRVKTAAHLLSLALPLAYLVGAWTTGLFGDFALKQALAVTAPALLNWLAIEETLKFNDDQPAPA